MIIDGDFNEFPHNPAIIEMKKHFKSAFEVALGGKEPEFTTFKYRELGGY